jgi:hypothetical protein
VTVSFWGSIVSGQSWQPPADSVRCPSKWGSGDQRRAGNHMNAQTVLRAARLIRTGEVFELGRVLSDSMPLSAGRRFEVITKRRVPAPGATRTGDRRESQRARRCDSAAPLDRADEARHLAL